MNASFCKSASAGESDGETTATLKWQGTKETTVQSLRTFHILSTSEVVDEVC